MYDFGRRQHLPSRVARALVAYDAFPVSLCVSHLLLSTSMTMTELFLKNNAMSGPVPQLEKLVKLEKLALDSNLFDEVVKHK